MDLIHIAFVGPFNLFYLVNRSWLYFLLSHDSIRFKFKWILITFCWLVCCLLCYSMRWGCDDESTFGAIYSTIDMTWRCLTILHFWDTFDVRIGMGREWEMRIDTPKKWFVAFQRTRWIFNATMDGRGLSRFFIILWNDLLWTRIDIKAKYCFVFLINSFLFRLAWSEL